MDLVRTDTNAQTRRGVLRRGLALAVTAPALASVLQVSTALADDDDNDRDDHRRGRAAAAPRARINSFRSDLVRVADTSNDFAATSPGSDPLVDGRLRLRRRGNTNEGRLQVELRGAAANVSYDVFFQTSKGARESLGTIGPTNAAGNLNALTPAALGGTNRVGVFVLARAGQDEFVSSMGG